MAAISFGSEGRLRLQPWPAHWPLLARCSTMPIPHRAVPEPSARVALSTAEYGCVQVYSVYFYISPDPATLPIECSAVRVPWSAAPRGSPAYASLPSRL